MSKCANDAIVRRGRGLAALTAAILALTLGCHSLKMNVSDRTESRSDGPAVPVLPSKYSFRVAPYIFISDFEAPRDQPLFQELAGMRDQICKELQLPLGNTPVQVYLFEDRKSYDAFMQARYPDLPERRAFFIAQPRAIGGSDDLIVYTFWGKNIQQDLRHELTHALLHSVIRDVPLWLDEGLAEYFELPPDWQGVNPAHVENLLHTGSFPYKSDLPRLENLTEVKQMTPAEYREAWAWVHLMLRDKPEAKTVLTGYLHLLHQNAAPGPLEPKLAAVYPAPDDAFDRHLAQLEGAVRPAAAADH